MTQSTEKSIIEADRHISLSALEFQGLAEIPPEIEWFASLESVHTRRAYEGDIRDFMRFAQITSPEMLRLVNRAHILAWRKSLEYQKLSGATIRRKLAALASLYEFLCESNAVEQNPVKGVKRPKVDTYEGKTPALGDMQAKALLLSPDISTLKGLRDRAILSVFLFHALRREEVTKLRVRDFGLLRSGLPHIRVSGKGGKTRFIPLNPATIIHVNEYLERSEHKEDEDSPLFLSIRNTRSEGKGISANGIYEHIVRSYLRKIGVSGELLAPHALRATAATNALLNEADIAKVQEWLGHSNIQTTRLYDRRSTRPEESPTFRIHY